MQAAASKDAISCMYVVSASENTRFSSVPAIQDSLRERHRATDMARSDGDQRLNVLGNL
jgi:hypothetical protein